MPITLSDRYRGCLLGLACGDAVGTTVEFMPRGSFAPVTGMAGGGPFGLKAGQWTDDTSMALCLAESLLERGGFDAADQMNRYVQWWQSGHLSSTGECFDIGMTVRAALARYQESGDPFAGSTDRFAAGNGSMMRLAPVVLFGFPDAQRTEVLVADSSRTTHGAQEAIECCVVLGRAISNALRGAPKSQVLEVDTHALTEAKVIAIAHGNFYAKTRADIAGSGYSVASLEAAFWCFAHTDSFTDAVLMAANLGDDADTTAAIVGQLAGAHYGVGGITAEWLNRVWAGHLIQKMADDLLRVASNHITR